MSDIVIPYRSRGRQSAAAQAKYEDDLEAFCDDLLQIQSTIEFKVSSRGWCYQLEPHGVDAA